LHRGLPYSDRYVAAGLSVDTETFQGANAMRTLLKQTPMLDGVFCYSDPLAIGAMNTILEAGTLSAPDPKCRSRQIHFWTLVLDFVNMVLLLK